MLKPMINTHMPIKAVAALASTAPPSVNATTPRTEFIDSGNGARRWTTSAATSVFASGRAYDQVRLGIAHNELKVRIGASHGGVSLGEDGASHQMIEDIALMRVMPNMSVVVPADSQAEVSNQLQALKASDRPDGCDEVIFE